MRLSGICLDGDRGSAVRFDHRDRCGRLGLVAGVADCDAVSTRAIYLLDAWLDRLAVAPSR
jgi:hypothetical protein